MRKNRNLAVWNLILIVIACAANATYQVFCVPVLWATIVLMVVFFPVVFHPMLSDRLGRFGSSVFFLLGVASCVCIYCILFLAEMNLFGLVMVLFGIGLLVYVPHYLLFQIIRTVKRETDPLFRRAFWIGVSFSGVIAICFAVDYRIALNNLRDAGIERTVEGRSVPRTYMAEKILGLHWKYHTRFCGYDGWRPPLHDPAAVIGYWANGCDGLSLDLETRRQLHERFFPNDPPTRCRCAAHDRLEPFWDP
jgi:hypothetical protein